ncbi:MlaE family ABC transporter permease [Cytophaga hutchinsonii]|jgi:phospholipid/cholesterol/gamma-HCH transport system permease protein|uniref:ABC transporter, permease n=1 Tax=Cytophaga hutchinsonii (strain ATCC 33406 / DSM 1761 / CIP 103989 / NBRC 15051 / NCIMB 9469 / D465) TaxID=269798 RepID=A0A6N4SSV2_CYTH3|nr:ABC transporter permease [Cytophaga hutchinsonii]ABG59457.1 ABC transporter, permease [Cytophaga hutchinsonii ATCC 33406]SFX96445.1 phospholipid/cholesterol/gamma-HCH transport system permease protein [Cytophaga hutchinsonii ATCC 33406]
MKSFGKYMILMGSLFVRREKFSVYWKLTIDECILIGTNSIFIVAIVSSFIGAVTCIQTAANLVSPLVPIYVVASVVREMSILELAPTFTCVVLAGKVGSSIAGQLGTMRITEQVDALEVMGINSASYLILPKILASLITIPMLVTFAGLLSILGGYIAGILGNIITTQDFVYGVQIDFNEFNVTFALIKAFVFAFLISSISAYQGYFTKGGALEVGQSSTTAVVNSCIGVLVADLLLAQLLLN